MTSLHPSHLTQRPSGTLLRCRSSRMGFGFLLFLNQAMGDRAQGWPAAPRRSGLRGLLRLFGLEVVVDTQAQTGGVVHLPRRLLGVLQLREPVLDLGELLLDQPVELVHLLAGHREGILVELSLLVGQRHGSSRGSGCWSSWMDRRRRTSRLPESARDSQHLPRVV